jgi:hypothetical protein
VVVCQEWTPVVSGSLQPKFNKDIRFDVHNTSSDQLRVRCP